MADGWTVSKTNGNHLRLEHPRAEKPIFTSSTPSCARAIKNMEAQCRRALRQVVPHVTTAPFADVKPDFSDYGPRKRRKLRHRDMVMRGLDLGMPQERAVPAFMLEATHTDVSTAALGASAPSAPVQSAATAPATAKKSGGNGAALVEGTLRDPKGRGGDDRVRDTKNNEIELKVEKDMATAALKIATPSEAPVAQVEPLVVEPVSVSHDLLDTLMAVQRGEHDRLMELAGRIHRGELKPITVTADMVGSTIWVSADAVVAGARMQTAAREDLPGDVSAETGRVAATWQDRFAELERHLSDEWQSLGAILAAAGLDSVGGSRKQSYRNAMRMAAEAGLVSRDDSHAMRKLYRKLAK